MKNVTLAIIGGSSLSNFDALKTTGQAFKMKEVSITTPFGKPSDKIKIISLDDEMQVAFLARHGSGHIHTPSEVPYKANIYALKSLGVEKILSISAVGSLHKSLRPEDWLFPEQVIDRTKGVRESTFFGKGVVGHISFAEPFCLGLQNHLYKNLKQKVKRLYKKGTYICMEGPAFSTIAESNLYRSWGGKIIGMTAIPEAKLAREAEMCYALLTMVTDYDCWKKNEHVTLERLIGHLIANTNAIKKNLELFIRTMATYKICGCQTHVKDSIMTSKDKISPQQKKDLNILYGKYF